MEDLKDVIETVRNALFIDEELEAFERIVDRLEGYEIAYNTILASNERLEKANKLLESAVEEDDKTKERYANEIKRLNELLGLSK